MFVNAAAPLLLFSFAFLWTKVQVQECQSFSMCNSSCYWDSCCQMKCTDYCNHTFSCQIHHETITAGHVRWCTVEVKDTLTPSLINITFASASACTVCSNENDMYMCCDSADDTVLRINCSTVSTYSAVTPSSQSSAVIPPVSSVPLMRTHLLLTHDHTHFTNSTINTVSSVLATPSSSVPATSTIISVIVPAVVGTALLILLTSVIAITCILVVIHKKHSKGKPTKARKQNQNMNVDMTECEAYSKLEINSEKINMTACSAYGTLQTLQNAVHPEYEDVAAI